MAPDNDKLHYEARLDSFELYYKYYVSPTDNDNADWKTATLHGLALPALGHAVSGALGAAVSNVVTYPLNLIVTMMQSQKRQRSPKQKEKAETREAEENEGEGEVYNSLLDAARKIYAREGIKGFYTGVVQDTGKTVADAFLFFLAYTFLRQKRLDSRSRAARGGGKKTILPVLDELAIGIIAGAFTKLLTTPLANITTRKQTAGLGSSLSSSMSTREIASQIRAEKGLRGFWSGYSASLILTLNPSITFFLNELLKYVLLSRAKREKPPAAVTFLLAATSKAAASSITYPFSLAKTRAQADSNHQRRQKKQTIFSTILQISRTEGPLALYAGLRIELLKGFFSHGITILTKDTVHALIIRVYYALLVLLSRYPSPEDLLARAREQAEELAEGTEKKIPKGVVVSVDMTSVGPAGRRHGHGPCDANETAEIVADYVEDEAEEWRSLYRWFWEKARNRD
ncbi:hypothetical protein VTN00DRAFT_6732 [Thermoascus crustaceus]|uniref:uncharacterized protein n=1 Tax=Thermoascus crustaceus TaxID=5088 RepID=UPI003744A8B1